MELPRLGLNQKRAVKKDDRVNYMDGSALLRPLTMPWAFRAIVIVFVAVGVAVGAVILVNVYDAVVLAPQREAEDTQKYLTQQTPLQLPVLTSLVQLSDSQIMATLQDAGYATFDMNTIGGATEGAGIDVMKLPEGVSLVDAGIAYSNGISKLSSSDAARYLNGSWRFTVGRGGYLDMKVKYADFASGTLQAAIQSAIDQEGLSGTAFGESGVDSAGNTFQSGTVDVDGTVYNWQVSACLLSEVYSIDGLPENSFYVGVRMYL